MHLTSLLLVTLISYATLLLPVQGKGEAGSGETNTCLGISPATRKLHLLVLGGSGKTGLHLVNEALCREHNITMVIRNALAKKKLSNQVKASKNVRILIGDLTDPEFVWRVVAGQDAVLSALGYDLPGLAPWHRVQQPYLTTVFRVLAIAMRAKGVQKLVYLSAAGVGEKSWKLLPIPMRVFITLSALSRVFKLWDEVQELLEKESHLEIEAVKPMILTDAPRTGKQPQLWPQGSWFSVNFIARADVAMYMMNEVEKSKLTTRDADILVSGDASSSSSVAGTKQQL